MKLEQWPQIDKVFQAAVERAPEERAAFLDEACQGDEELRRAVETMLASDELAESFIEAPALALAASILVEDKTESLVGRTISHYRIVSLLGRGGMGEVYLAEDTALQRKVAIKVLPAENPEGAKRLRREAQAAAALDHPNIGAIYEVGEEQGRSFIVMQYIEGETLAARMQRQPLSLDDALSLGFEVADALAEAHGRRIIHRDIKPANIIIDARGHAKVLDFGLARKIKSEASLGGAKDSQSLLSSPGLIVGTPAYMSPEQVRGEELDARTDIFSFGVMLYEMISGAHPFARENSAETAAAIQLLEPPPLARYAPKAPAEIARILNRALVKERENRYQTIKELLNDLRILKSETVIVDANAKAEDLVSKIKRHKMGLTVVLGAIVAMIIVVAYLPSIIRHRSQAAKPPIRPLRRLTFEPGLQCEPTWAPKNDFIAYSSDRSGNFDIWVQPISGGDPIPITHSSAHDWQPDWSPDGSQIVFRSEREGGGLFVVPAFGGRERKISAFGAHPRWSPDGTKVLFGNTGFPTKVYVVALDGQPPREVQPELIASFIGIRAFSWHPDGQRVSLLGENKPGGCGLWIAPLTGGVPVLSKPGPEVDQEVSNLVKEIEFGEFNSGGWAPSGRTFYFCATSQWLRKLWKVAVDPQTLRWIAAPERLTAGISNDTDIALSSDGKRLAFSTQIESTRAWSLPFDAGAGRIKAQGQASTSTGMNPTWLNLSPDGKKILFVAKRPGSHKDELWEKSLDDSRETLLTVFEGCCIFTPSWSRDGARIAYRGRRPANSGRDGFSILVLPSGGGDEQVIASGADDLPWDWSADGKWILATTDRNSPRHVGQLCLYPLSAGPHAETEMRVITSSPEHNLFEARISPNDRWICFQATKSGAVATIYVVSTAGGEWIPITEGKYGDDKPRWSPDGKTIYFISKRTGFYNVWGNRFDPSSGKPVGEPFRVTNFESPNRMISTDIPTAELGVAANRLVLPIMEVSGSIWIMENVDR